MRVRKARTADLPQIVELARTLGLDYPGMERDDFWVAEDEGRLIGLVGLKKHADCLELCALGVDPGHRGKGIAKSLAEALIAGARAEIHLATVRPVFFEALGFEKTTDVPRAFLEKRKTAWCEGCDARLCTVMVRKVS
jgi:N-acetylglutamate synthase-like GNAT family acetyltransferase